MVYGEVPQIRIRVFSIFGTFLSHKLRAFGFVLGYKIAKLCIDLCLKLGKSPEPSLLA